ncbi:hypothetical protein ACJRO7_019079 [Eucalyptus globulus]|uniref:RRM domain-containing protein n=1 Tax=Eucalyptus globulus TaxID=34317 RepID=A0ABD3L248_EUCGL
MGDGTEVDERVDLDEDNYMEEEIDDDIEEQQDEDAGDGADEDNADDDPEEIEDSKEDGVAGEDQSPDTDTSPAVANPVEDEERPAVSLSAEEIEKHAQILALPPHGSEVFIGGLPRDILEEELRDLCEPIGEIHEIRLMKDKGTGESKGYAFVAYRTREMAQKAIEELHSKEFKGKTLRCSLSETKNRLFIGNVPKSWTEDEFRKIIEDVGPGVENIELIKDPQNPGRNRGFAFILYYNNACADYSRQKMASSNFKLDGNTPTVTWADPKSAPDHSAASQSRMDVRSRDCAFVHRTHTAHPTRATIASRENTVETSLHHPEISMCKPNCSTPSVRFNRALCMPIRGLRSIWMEKETTKLEKSSMAMGGNQFKMYWYCSWRRVAVALGFHCSHVPDGLGRGPWKRPLPSQHSLRTPAPTHPRPRPRPRPRPSLRFFFSPERGGGGSLGARARL